MINLHIDFAGNKKSLKFCNVLALLFLILIVPLAAHCANDKHHLFYKAYVTRIIDGDSIEIERNGKKELIRLWGIDAPEWRQTFSFQAKAFLQRKILDKHVEVEKLYFDDYGRNVALVFHKKRNINEMLVKEGYAWVHIYYCDKIICEKWKKFENSAKHDKKGLWYYEPHVAPWEWKKKKRKPHDN